MGTEVTPGMVIGVVQETPLLLHKIMVPNGVTGRVKEVLLVILRLMKRFIFLRHQKENAPFDVAKWPVRHSRPVKQKLNPVEPMITGQRVIDTFSNRKGEPLRSLAPSVRENSGPTSNC